ncbi:MAG: aldehyde ferredoxin oxidoreductase C-terminal domain-containing protein, partial [Candidatus Heimdallarchaeota archaeon]
VKGLEIPMHDPRAFAGQALNYMTSCIGASHEKADWYSVEIKMVEETKLRIKTGDRFDITKRERGVVALQDIRAIDDAAVNCNVLGPSFDHVVDFINAATGFNYNRKGLIKVGERINNIKRVINCNLGITRDDDKLPAIVLKPLKAGRSLGVKLDLDDNLKVYYKNRSWDWETGRPTDEKLKNLGII